MKNRSLTIAFIGGRGVAGAYSGIETYYEEVGSRLTQRGHSVTVYCRNHFTPAVSTYRGLHVRRLPSIRHKHIETLSHTILCTVDTMRRSYDIVQYHAIGTALFSLLPRLWHQKTILSVRGLDWQRAKWGKVARMFLQIGEWASARCPTATVVVSRTLQEYYVTEHRSTPFLIPNAVILAERRRPERIRRFGLAPNGFVLFAGRLSPEKGVHILLEAMRPFRGRTKLVLAGGSSYSDDYIKALHHASWEDVLFLGNVDRQTMQELYSNCYAFVLPSAMEGLSISLLEALSYAACILATDIPENLEVIGSAGLSFPPGDVDGLRAHLESIFANPSLASEYRNRAAARIAAQPTWDDVTQRTEELYYQVCALPT